MSAALTRKQSGLMSTTQSQFCSTCGSRSDSYATDLPKPRPCKLVQGGSCALCRELDDFDIGYQAILQDLTQQRRNILQRINERHDPFIQRFPFEIASQVFVFCLPRQLFDSNPATLSLVWDDSKDSSITPFNIVLGSICQSWRRIAWSTPNLWSTLPIRLHRCDRKTQMDLTLEWFGRSAHIPLDVTVAYDLDSIPLAPDLTEENIGLWKPLIDIVNGCSSRWKTFVMDVPELVHSYVVGNGEPTSILERLKLGGPDFFRRLPIGFSLTNALPMPSELVSGAVPLRLIDIGWSNLTTVRITNFYINECLVLLQWAPRLITFTINGLQRGLDETLPAPAPTTHNTLICLDIFDLDEWQLLNFLTLPSLMDLSYNSDSNALDDVTAFLQRSGCRLTELRIEAYDLDKITETMMASNLQALENLEYHGNLDDCLYCLNKPTNRDDAPISLPNLHKLAIWDRPRNWSGLADLFQSRPLGTLAIHLTCRISENARVDQESALRFQDLIKKGHDITVMGLLMGENGKEHDLLPWIIEVWVPPTKTAV